MLNTLIPILALSPSEVIAVLVAIGIILAGIFGQANEAKKSQRRREALKRGDTVPGDRGPVTGLDEIAQRRRQQLEALARKRRGGGETRPAAVPPPLTQATKRESAQVEYEAGQSSKRELQEVNPMLAWGESGGAAQAGADAERSAMETRRAAKQRDSAKQGQQQRTRRKQEAKAQRQAQLQRQKAREPVPVEEVEEPRPRGLSVLGGGVTTVETSIHAGAYDTEEVHRHVPDASTTPALPRASKVLALMKGRSWRDVFLLKEVLDPPVSMRDSIKASDPFAH